MDESFYHTPVMLGEIMNALRVRREQLRVVDYATGKKYAADILVGVALLPAYRVTELLVGDDPIGEQNFPNKMIVQQSPPLLLSYLTSAAVSICNPTITPLLRWFFVIFSRFYSPSIRA